MQDVWHLHMQFKTCKLGETYWNDKKDVWKMIHVFDAGYVDPLCSLLSPAQSFIFICNFGICLQWAGVRLVRLVLKFDIRASSISFDLSVWGYRAVAKWPKVPRPKGKSVARLISSMGIIFQVQSSWVGTYYTRRTVTVNVDNSIIMANLLLNVHVEHDGRHTKR